MTSPTPPPEPMPMEGENQTLSKYLDTHSKLLTVSPMQQTRNLFVYFVYVFPLHRSHGLRHISCTGNATLPSRVASCATPATSHGEDAVSL